MKPKPKKWWEVRKKGWWRAFRNIPVFWMHQRTTYMDKSELIFHLALNFLATVLIYFILFAAGCFSGQWVRLLIAAIMARTLSYLFNDHFWGGLLVSFNRVRNCGAEQIRQYLIDSETRLSKCHSIHACTVYGSIVRGEFHDKSDLDVRYIRQPGFLNAISALAFAARERVIAFFTRTPLDSYVGDTEKFLYKMRDDEVPIIIKDSDSKMVKKYPTSVSFQKFLQEFKVK